MDDEEERDEEQASRIFVDSCCFRGEAKRKPMGRLFKSEEKELVGRVIFSWENFVNV